MRTIQRQLNRIARNYPFFGTLEVDGVFGASTEAVVKKFQKQFSLAQDGVVGRDTWYKISYIYVAVKKLAELSSEGEAATGKGVSFEKAASGSRAVDAVFILASTAVAFPIGGFA